MVYSATFGHWMKVNQIYHESASLVHVGVEEYETLPVNNEQIWMIAYWMVLKVSSTFRILRGFWATAIRFWHQSDRLDETYLSQFRSLANMNYLQLNDNQYTVIQSHDGMQDPHQWFS
jgi:hypothetical protein